MLEILDQCPIVFTVLSGKQLGSTDVAHQNPGGHGDDLLLAIDNDERAGSRAGNDARPALCLAMVRSGKWFSAGIGTLQDIDVANLKPRLAVPIMVENLF